MDSPSLESQIKETEVSPPPNPSSPLCIRSLVQLTPRQDCHTTQALHSSLPPFGRDQAVVVPASVNPPERTPFILHKRPSIEQSTQQGNSQALQARVLQVNKGGEGSALEELPGGSYPTLQMDSSEVCGW